MALANTITESEKQWLLNLIEEQFNITLNSHYTCKEFSNVLEKQFQIQISYNTLRRLFGIVLIRFLFVIYIIIYVKYVHKKTPAVAGVILC